MGECKRGMQRFDSLGVGIGIFVERLPEVAILPEAVVGGPDIRTDREHAQGTDGSEDSKAFHLKQWDLCLLEHVRSGSGADGPAWKCDLFFRVA